MTVHIAQIIVQAGGRGSRLGHHTDNKPKALVSIHGEPLIVNQMRKYPKASYYVIADYKKDIFDKYLSIFAPARYKIITPVGKHTCSGIKSALKQIPDNTPFIIVWCDLYFSSDMLPRNIFPKKFNYIGLSKTFPCRWSFQKGKCVEERSETKGIAGLFIFKNRNELADVPEDGEFCRYLQQKRVKFKPFYIKDVYEIGTLEAYEAAKKNFHNTRPFNALRITKKKIIKIPKDKQGKQLATKESRWYKKISKKEYLPTIYKTSPITMQKIDGKSLYQYPLSDSEKEEVLKKIITNIGDLHKSFPPKKGSFTNDYEAILKKTKSRLDSIATLISDIQEDYIFVNGKKCINFYKEWHIVANLLEPFLGNNYVFIHGDATFSNILYEEKNSQAYFIDPRGYYGKSLLFGDEDYDWAKIYYSIAGNYDQFNNKNFKLKIDAKNNIIAIQSNHWEHLANKFFMQIKRDRKKIEAYHAIIWLSLTSYAWDDYDSICGAFYNGIYLMQQIYEKKL